MKNLNQAIFCSLLLVGGAASEALAAEGTAATPDATIEFKATSVNVGVGGTSGEGTLTWKGNKIPFTIAKGLNLGRIGVSASSEIRMPTCDEILVTL